MPDVNARDGGGASSFHRRIHRDAGQHAEQDNPVKEDPMKMKLPRKSGNYPREVAISRAPSKIRTILAATDFSNESLAGVRHAMALAEKLGAAVALVHVVELVPRMPGMEAVGFALRPFQ